MLKNLNLSEDTSKKIKYLSLTFLYIIVIALNVLDFVNFLSLDLDFFKKIISLGLISFLFYKVSAMKIFFGVRKKIYDVILIIIFLLLTLPKLLFKYVSITNLNEFSFEFFKIPLIYLVKQLINFEPYKIIDLLFFIGLILYTLFFIYIFLNTKEEGNCFISSFNFTNTFKHLIQKILVSYFSLLFFGIIIFNFFVEWFAFAIDYFILFIGLIFLTCYFIYHFRKKQNADDKNLISNIANFGNDLYVNCIEYLKDKKTFFYTIVILFACHLFIDFVVFVLSYSLGFFNSFYFYDLNLISENQRALFNLLDIKSSVFFEEITLNSGFLSIGIIFFLYLLYITFFSIILTLPLYVIFKKFKKEEININKNIIYFILFFLILYVFKLISNYILNINLFRDIFIVKILSGEVLGLFYETQTLFIEKIDYLYFFVILAVAFFTFVYLIFKIYTKEKFIQNIFIVCLKIFLLFYILIFAFSVCYEQYEIIKLKNLDQTDNSKVQELNSNFDTITSLYNSRDNFFSSNKFSSRDGFVEFSFFSSLNRNLSNIEDMKNYMLVDIKTDNKVFFKYIKTNCKYNIFRCDFFIEKDFKYFKYYEFLELKNNKIIIPLNKDSFSVLNKSLEANDLNVKINFDEKAINSIFYFKKESLIDRFSFLFSLQNILLLIFNLFFYIGGVFYLIYLFFRKE